MGRHLAIVAIYRPGVPGLVRFVHPCGAAAPRGTPVYTVVRVRKLTVFAVFD
jgi:hypothetical protein